MTLPLGAFGYRTPTQCRTPRSKILIAGTLQERAFTTRRGLLGFHFTKTYKLLCQVLLAQGYRLQNNLNPNDNESKQRQKKLDALDIESPHTLKPRNPTAAIPTRLSSAGISPKPSCLIISSGLKHWFTSPAAPSPPTCKLPKSKNTSPYLKPSICKAYDPEWYCQ